MDRLQQMVGGSQLREASHTWVCNGGHGSVWRKSNGQEMNYAG